MWVMIIDSFAFMPLLIASVASFVTIVVLLADREQYNSLSLVLQVLCAALMSAVSLYTAIYATYNLLVIGVAIASILIVLAVFINRFSKARNNDSASSSQKNALSQENIQHSVSEDIIPIAKDFVVQVTDSLVNISKLTPFIDKVNTTLLQTVKADGSVLLLIDEFEDLLVVESLVGAFPPPYRLPQEVPHTPLEVENSFRSTKFTLDQTIFGTVARTGKAELITNPREDSRLVENLPEPFLSLGSFIIVPLKVKDTVIGVLALSRSPSVMPFTKEDFDTATDLCDIASAAINIVYVHRSITEREELTREAGVASKIQSMIQLKKLPSIPTLSLGTVHQRAAGVCGDYYDIIPARKDRISFIVSDVAGKGITSLVIILMLRAMVRLTVNTKQSASTILTWLNKELSGEINLDHFASVALINYNIENSTIQFSVGGTIPIYLYKKSTGEISKISNITEPIGVEKSSVYTDDQCTVETDDIVISYTDGIVETTNINGEQYSKNRLLEVVKKNAHLSGKEIANKIRSELEAFSGEQFQHDDQTLLVLKIQ
ncbi:MAG: SpoIIE family protein phosphatase [Spirochaetia bacterium]|nr:SpoIIE family protein phosphatase [Spirochaetia bacterium]